MTKARRRPVEGKFLNGTLNIVPMPNGYLLQPSGNGLFLNSEMTEELAFLLAQMNEEMKGR